jgi:hypothetical protein
MIRRPAGALAGIAMIVLLTAPAGAARPAGPPRGVFDVPRPAVPLRDLVLAGPNAGSAAISATAPTARYPVGDGRGSSIAVGVTAACRQSCTAADPQAIANFVGTLPHGGEINLLSVQLDTDWQIGYDCGYGAQACYDWWGSRIIVSGNDDVQPDGASREFVLAHEYGHHVAGHRPAPLPFSPAIDWGTPRWASYENVCRGQRTGRLFPGNEGRHYYENPGEAFAESFAFNRFPDSPVRWSWTPSLKPNAAAFAAIRRDVYRPWAERIFTVHGRLPSVGARAVTRTFRTPLDGHASLSLRGPGSGAFELLVRNGAGRKLRDTFGGTPLEFTVCDQDRLRTVIKLHSSNGRRFTLAVERP